MASIDIILNSDSARGKQERPTYHGGDLLKGFLEVNTCLEGSLCAVLTFEGHARTWLNLPSSLDIARSVRTAEHQFLKQTLILELSSSNRENRENRHKGQHSYRVPFEFVVPERLISSHSDIPSEYLSLPPSVRTGRAFHVHHGANGSTEYMQPCITYLVNAALFDVRQPDMTSHIYQGSREISIMPHTTPSPPILTSHFPHEYRLTSSAHLKRHRWSQRSLGTFAISANEPQPLNLATTGSKASTLLSINISYTPPQLHNSHDHHRRSQMLTKLSDMSISSHLLARTFYSTHRFASIPTLASIKQHPDTIALHLNATKPENRVCSIALHAQSHPPLEPLTETYPPFLNEKSGTSSSSSSLSSSSSSSSSLSSTNPTTESTAAAWTTTLMIPISTPKNLAPTFLAPLVARRYAIVVEVTLAGYSHQKLELEIPVQVVCDPEAKRRGSWRMEESGAEISGAGAAADIGDGNDAQQRPPPYMRTR